MAQPQPTILHVEDERPIRRFVRPALEGIGCRVLEAGSRAEGRTLAASYTPDAVVLDLGLPDGDGKDLIREIREWSAMPIIVVTARDEEREKVAALDLGADDYLTKPFSVPELLARVRVALRHAARVREGAGAAEPVFAVGELSIDLARRRVKLAGADVELTPLEFKLLAELAKQPGRVMTHRTLLLAVWGPGRSNEPHLVRVHMANLRKKVEADPARPRYLLTEMGVGYRLADE
jgi:two-component system KDP operon response regulator KdpE